MLLSLPSSREENEQSDKTHATIRWWEMKGEKKKGRRRQKWHGRLRLFKRKDARARTQEVHSDPFRVY